MHWQRQQKQKFLVEEVADAVADANAEVVSLNRCWQQPLVAVEVDVVDVVLESTLADTAGELLLIGSNI